METVAFITTEDSDDLIVSFAVASEDFSDVKSLTLLRTPKYEFVLEEHERGVHVSYDDFPDEEDDLLEQVEFEGLKVRLVTRYHRYELDLGRVDDAEIGEAKRILEKMDFDKRFRLSIVE